MPPGDGTETGVVVTYLLFAYDSYYPGGGFNDLVGIFETLEAAQNAVHKKDGYGLTPAEYDWVYIEEVEGSKRGRRWKVERSDDGVVGWRPVSHDDY